MSRHDQRSTRLRHRPSRAVPSLIAGILLLAAGVALAWLSHHPAGQRHVAHPAAGTT